MPLRSITPEAITSAIIIIKFNNLDRLGPCAHRQARVTHTELPDEPFGIVISLPARSRARMHRPQGIRWRSKDIRWCSQDIRWRPHQMPPSQHQMLRRRNQMAPSLMAPLAI